MSSEYSVDSANVLQEVIDGDVIMINLANDRYYTMNKSGQFIWSLLQQGFGVSAIVNTISKQCNVASKNVKEQVKAFVNQLLAERLLMKRAATVGAGAVPAGMILSMSNFSDPLLSVFDDLHLMCKN